jgi:DNA polymerase
MATAIERLNEQILACKKCELGQEQKTRVLGTGSSNPQAIIVGEAPGEYELKAGKPFSDPTAPIITEALIEMGIPEERIWKTMLLKCPTPDHRDPKDREIRACQQYLREEIRALNPRFIIAMGRSPAYFFTGIRKSVEDLRGKIRLYRQWPVIITYHPIGILRFPFLKARLLQDLELIEEISGFQKSNCLYLMRGQLESALEALDGEKTS